MSDLTDWISAIGGLSGFVALGATGFAEIARRRRERLNRLLVRSEPFGQADLLVTVTYRPHSFATGMDLVVITKDTWVGVRPAPDRPGRQEFYRPPRRPLPNGLGDREAHINMTPDEDDARCVSARFLICGDYAPRVRLLITSGLGELPWISMSTRLSR